MFWSARRNYFRDDYCYQPLGMFVSTLTGAVYVAQFHFNFISVKGIVRVFAQVLKFYPKRACIDIEKMVKRTIERKT